MNSGLNFTNRYDATAAGGAGSGYDFQDNTGSCKTEGQHCRAMAGKLKSSGCGKFALSISCIMFAETGSQITQRTEDERAAGEVRTPNRVLFGCRRGNPALMLKIL